MPSHQKTFIRGLHNLRPEHRGNVVTIGSFDGVHLGHQAILKQVRDEASRLDVPSLVMIFEPQPQEYFLSNRKLSKRERQEQAPARLMRLREKVDALFAEGIDRICCLPFNTALRGLTAQQFIEQVLVKGLGVKTLVVGDDFRFGCDRSGDFELLQKAGKVHGFEVRDTLTVARSEERISSTRIRRELEAGNFDEAATLLGKPFMITGKVVYGQQLGRKLGVPTANVHLFRYRVPLSGVFAVEMELAGKRIQGVANVGVRPTVEQSVKPILEVHLFDWNRDIYGQRIAVEFKHKIREELKFASLEELKAAIENDIEQAKAFFAGVKKSD